MDIPKIGAGPAQTEWRQNVGQADTKAPAPREESFGSQLNRLSGAQGQGKNLYEKKGELTKEAYLKMLMEQLKFQDPFNPVKNDQFSQQMTSLSQLEQQVNTNKNLEKMIQAQSNQQIAALQLVGKNVLADRGAVYHDKDKPSQISFKLPQDASELSVEILNGAGEKIRTIPIGPHETGDVLTKWDGIMDQGAPVESGRYSYRVAAKDIKGNDIPISTKVDGRVSGITTSQGITYLLVGEQRVGLGDIETIKEGVSESSAPGANGANAFGGTTAPTNLASNGNLAGINTETKKESDKVADAKDKKSADAPSISIDEESKGSLTNPMLPIFMR